MSVNEVTQNFLLPLPHRDNDLLTDVGRLRDALSGLDTLTFARPTTAQVQAMIQAVVAAAPAALDTLKELADALNGDPNFATTITNALAQKAALNHTHTIAQVQNLQQALDGKLAAVPVATETVLGGVKIPAGGKFSIAGDGALSLLQILFSELGGKPTTVAGYGITDAVSAVTTSAVLTANFTAQVGMLHLVDTSAGVLTATMPVNPNPGNECYFLDYGKSFDVNNLTLDRNTRNFAKLSENYTINKKNVYRTARYINAVYGWNVR